MKCVLYIVYCFAILRYNVKQAESYEFDFIVSISRKNYAKMSLEEDYHICGGALITTTHVLTSAHCECEGSVDLEDYTVKVGHDLRNPEANFSISTWNSYQKCCCSLFRRGNMCNDISVITLFDDIYSKITREIVLPVLNYSPIEQLYNKNATSAGWGDGINMLHPRYMLKVTMRTISKEECQRNIDMAPIVVGVNDKYRSKRKRIIKNNTLCSNGNPVPGVIPYTTLGGGDSGSPLMIGNNEIIAINTGVFPPESPEYYAYQQSLHVTFLAHREFIERQLKNANEIGCFGRK
ncbi:trypsin-like isoform X2 [Phymastichus coffea]|uniref:trypsin-like isoform X2 n=1 Tax=Phymastichus coffea TaxID=108790 RepID=UPI00273AEBD5|nr:trypsin-like isoform X2 [Phymastichus coffea]